MTLAIVGGTAGRGFFVLMGLGAVLIVFAFVVRRGKPPKGTGVLAQSAWDDAPKQRRLGTLMVIVGVVGFLVVWIRSLL